MTVRVERGLFGVLPEGRRVALITLTNSRGMEVRLTEFGGRVLSVRAPDRHGEAANVTPGCGTLEDCLRDATFAGALIGRYANRIAHGRFSLDGRDYALARNSGPHHLHGGPRGFAAVAWRADTFQSERGAGAALRYISPHGEEGYPGTLDVTVRCTLSDDDALRFEFRASTDRPTPVNFTQHSYFNLSGGERGVRDQVLTIHASRFAPVDATLIPTGELRSVRGTVFDFTAPAAIGARIEEEDGQLELAGGYDHTFVLDRPAGPGLAPAARLHDPESGRTLEILTTQPGLQCYSGKARPLPTGGAAPPEDRRPNGVALEAQHFPDSPNQPAFPGTILLPGQAYAERIEYRFSVGDRA